MNVLLKKIEFLVDKKYYISEEFVTLVDVAFLSNTFKKREFYSADLKKMVEFMDIFILIKYQNGTEYKACLATTQNPQYFNEFSNLGESIKYDESILCEMFGPNSIEIALMKIRNIQQKLNRKRIK